MTTNNRRKPRKSVMLLACLILLMSINAGLAQAYSGSPPNGRTGAPGEGDCTGCHSSFGVNSGFGTLSVSGMNGTYEAGQSYDLVVSLDDPGATRWGFEFTVLGDDGLALGTVNSLDNHTQVSSSATRDYAKQTSLGTQNGTSSGVTWNVRWTAPMTGSGDATIYLAGNAANGNFSTSGDYIYTTNETWTESNLTAAPMPLIASAVLLPNYPNPFNPRTAIVYELTETQSVHLTIFSLDGRMVKHLESGVRAEGRHEVLWNGMNDRGMAVPSGTYFYRLQSENVDQIRSMVLVR